MAGGERFNVVCVVVDSGRRDRFGCYGYPRPTTPTIDALARVGTVVEQMLSTAPWTLPSHASLFTGLYPREHGADYPGYRMRSGLLTLDRHLQDHGYRTAFVTSNPLVGKRTGIVDEASDLLSRREFDGWSSRTWARAVRVLLGRSDRGGGGATRAAVRLIQTLPKPFFLFINYMECHWRYMAPHRYEAQFVRQRFTPVDAFLFRRRLRRRFSWENGRLEDPEEQALLSDLYDAAVACVDDRIGDLLTALDRSHRSDDTVVIITADHGEQLGDHGLSGHGMWLYETLLHVPCVLRVPGRPPARITDLVQLTDVFAGLCRLLDLPLPARLEQRKFAADPDWIRSGRTGREYAFGEWHHSEASDLHRRLARSHFTSPPDMQCVRDARYKLIVQPQTSREWVFDLQEDPREEQDRAVDLQTERTRLARALEDWRATSVPQGTGRPYSPEEERVLEGRLRELGYL